jgi:hypothetical protein
MVHIKMQNAISLGKKEMTFIDLYNMNFAKKQIDFFQFSKFS